MINAATNTNMLDNQLFHIHDSWDLDPIKACSFWQMCVKNVRKNLINNFMKKKMHTPFLVYGFMFDCRLLGDRDIDWPRGYCFCCCFFFLLFL